MQHIVTAIRRLLAKPEIYTCEIHMEMVEFYSVFVR
jgi:hypothetical protein